MTSRTSIDILIYGHDRQLSTTRELILRKSGYLVVHAESEEEFCSLYLYSCPRLVLLCQTLNADESVRCMSYAMAESASVYVLVMFNQTVKALPPKNGGLVRSSAGPLCLMSMVETLIGPGHLCSLSS